MKETVAPDPIPDSEAVSLQKVLNRGDMQLHVVWGFRKTHLVAVRRRDWMGQVRWGAVSRGCLESWELVKKLVPMRVFLSWNLCTHSCTCVHTDTRAHSRTLTHCQMQKLLDQSHCSSWYQVAFTTEGESMETTAPESQFP